MLIDHTNKLVFLLPPKTGSSTLLSVLARSITRGGPPVSDEECWIGFENVRDQPEDMPGKPRPGQLRRHAMVWRPEFDGYRGFVTVRNPFTRMVSLWRTSGHRYRRRPFHEFIRHSEMGVWRGPRWSSRPQTMWAFRVPGGAGLVKLENIVEDIRKLPCVADDEEIPWKRHNGDGKDGRWWEHYTEADAQLVADIYADDFKHLGYSTDLSDYAGQEEPALTGE